MELIILRKKYQQKIFNKTNILICHFGHVVNRYPDKQCNLRKNKLFSGKQSYAEVSNTPTPNRN